MEPRTSSIEVKLNNHGRYTWKISIIFDLKNDPTKNIAQTIKIIDRNLRDEFPDHVTRGTGRVATIEED